MASRRLLRAASAGDVDAVDALIREGADPGFQVRAPAHWRHPSFVTRTMNEHRDGFSNRRSRPPLHPPSARQDRKGTTPLMLACEHGHVDVVRSLLAAGAPW